MNIEKMKKIIYFNIVIVSLLISISFANAHGEEDFAKAEELIKSKISCSELTNEQLEIIGDYYMEQMHPGELHEIMDERMGGEGSESLKQVHINIARAFYCGEHNMTGAGMMNIMMGRSGMMGNIGPYYAQNVYNQNNITNIILMILIVVLLIIVIFWLIKKLQRNNGKRKKS